MASTHNTITCDVCKVERCFVIRNIARDFALCNYLMCLQCAGDVMQCLTDPMYTCTSVL